MVLKCRKVPWLGQWSRYGGPSTKVKKESARLYSRGSKVLKSFHRTFNRHLRIYAGLATL